MPWGDGWGPAGADEFGEAGLVQDEVPVLAAQNPHSFEAVELGGDRLPRASDKVRQIFMSQAEVDPNSSRGLRAVRLAKLQQNLRQPVVGPGMRELSQLSFHFHQSLGKRSDKVQSEGGHEPLLSPSGFRSKKG